MLTLSEKAKALLQKKVLISNLVQDQKEPFRNTLKTHLLKRLLLLKFLLDEISWILKRSSRAKCKSA
jgi:hypothetical protein